MVDDSQPSEVDSENRLVKEESKSEPLEEAKEEKVEETEEKPVEAQQEEA